MIIIIGDWNAKLGNKAASNIIRKFLTMSQNEAGIWLVDLWKSTTCPWQTHASNNQTDDCTHGYHQMAIR